VQTTHLLAPVGGETLTFVEPSLSASRYDSRHVFWKDRNFSEQV
jgi:hypothetical protein